MQSYPAATLSYPTATLSYPTAPLSYPRTRDMCGQATNLERACHLLDTFASTTAIAYALHSVQAACRVTAHLHELQNQVELALQHI